MSDLKWTCSTADEPPATREEANIRRAGPELMKACIPLLHTFGGNAVLSALLGSYVNISHALGGDVQAVRQGLIDTATDVERVFALYDRDDANGKPN
ncbi:MAG: hypothetical protein AB7D00_14495 [Rhodospirillaceae bacterium]